MQNPKFETISHLGELIIVLFYAAAYEEAVSKGLADFDRTGAVLRNLLLFAIFLMVTVRFFVGNYLHLADERWNKGSSPQGAQKNDWTHEWTRKLYYFDGLFIALQSIAMIILGGIGPVAPNVNQLLIVLIVISCLDVFWIALQWVSDLIWKGVRPIRVPLPWMGLNIGVAASLGYLLCRFWGQPLETLNLWWIAGINFLAFVVDLVLVNQYAA